MGLNKSHTSKFELVRKLAGRRGNGSIGLVIGLRH